MSHKGGLKLERTRQSFIQSIVHSTSICTEESLLVTISSLSSNCCFPLRNGGMFKCKLPLKSGHLLKALICHHGITSPQQVQQTNPPHKILVLRIIGRAKRAPHWAVQLRFCVIYLCRYVCRVPKCVGGITCVHAQSQFWAVKTDL